MKIFEIWQELLKCDTETGNEQMLLEKIQVDLTRGCHKPSILKKMHIHKVQ